jgi:hypothetical protein
VNDGPVPPEFASETSGEIDLSCEEGYSYEFAMRWECFSLSCEGADGDEQWSYDWDCYSSDRRYIRNDDGYVFIDERVYRSGSPDNC